jgi:tRNA dimethylallyltransferase
MNEKNGAPKVAALIAGPTASGKSAVALALAEACGGMVINADSMQVYRDLKIITARPGLAEEARAPHLLYGHVDAAENYSVGRFLVEAAAVLQAAQRQGRLAIFVGGSGLYFKALTHGLAAIPPIPAPLRAAMRARLAAQGSAALHAELARRDPASAARIGPADRVRVVRALEVLEATGRGIADWQGDGVPSPLAGWRLEKIFLAPERETLYMRIDTRFDAMLAAGALDEVRVLAARGLDPLLPAMKAHGVPWLIRHLSGEITLDAAAEVAKRDTRHYAKRQFTWFRHQLADWPHVETQTALGRLMRAVDR